VLKSIVVRSVLVIKSYYLFTFLAPKILTSITLKFDSKSSSLEVSLISDLDHADKIC